MKEVSSLNRSRIFGILCLRELWKLSWIYWRLRQTDCGPQGSQEMNNHRKIDQITLHLTGEQSKFVPDPISAKTFLSLDVTEKVFQGHSDILKSTFELKFFKCLDALLQPVDGNNLPNKKHRRWWEIGALNIILGILLENVQWSPSLRISR